MRRRNVRPTQRRRATATASRSCRTAAGNRISKSWRSNCLREQADLAQPKLFEEFEVEAKVRVQEIEEQMAVLRQDVERTRDLLTREQDQRLKVVLPRRYQLREVRVLPLALTYLVPASKEDLQP